MLTYNRITGSALEDLLSSFGLYIDAVMPGQVIPGSYWGEPEAGLIGCRLFVRFDTPVHSILHESCHFICMSDDRRQTLDTDAGGDYAEENAVCYLQILMADQVPGYSAAQCMTDMDAWGYSFRLGSARAWFTKDALDAKNWLEKRGLLNLSTSKVDVSGGESDLLITSRKQITGSKDDTWV